MIHDDGRSNYSNNRPFQDIFKARFSRRSMLQKSMMLSAAGFIGAIAGNSVLKPSTAATQVAQRRTSPLLGFNAVTLAQGNGPVPSISSDYQYQVLIPWGTPIQPGGPEYNATPTPDPPPTNRPSRLASATMGCGFSPSATTMTMVCWQLTTNLASTNTSWVKQIPPALRMCDCLNMPMVPPSLKLRKIIVAFGKWFAVTMPAGSMPIPPWPSVALQQIILS